MSGVANITGFAPPASIPGFLDLLQTASWRGVPFKVVSAQVRKGRRWAVHEYPFVDGGWPEDMGRALRTYSFSGYLIGDLAPVMQQVLDLACETEGPGLLIHPTIGAVQAGLVSAATAVHRDKMRVIEVAFQFVEAGGNLWPLAIVATVVSVLTAAGSALTAANRDLASAAGPAAAIGPAVTGEGAAVVTAFASEVANGGANPAAIVGMAAALAPPDSNTSYGRYGAGSASTVLPEGTTVASLQAQLANQRAALALAGAGAVAAAQSYSASTDMMDALAALVEAMRAGITDPASQAGVLLGLAGFSFSDGTGGSVGVGAAMAAVRTAMAAACRRAALISLARASASYQPRSYQDAAALRESLAGALDAEITIAGDAGEDASYAALKALRSAVVRDLTVRGANLPSVVTVRMALPLPALTVAQMLYTDASRSDEIIARSGAVHPAFIPISFQALNSGMGPNVNVTVPSLTADGSGPLIAPSGAAGSGSADSYSARPPPPGPTGLDVLSATHDSITLSWIAPAYLGLLWWIDGFNVYISPHGLGAWTTAAQPDGGTTSVTIDGLTGSTEYDFQVTAFNILVESQPSALVSGTTLVNAPNPATGLSVSAGSPSATAAVLSWTASAVDIHRGPAADYQPQYQPSGGAWTSFGSPVSGTSVTITGLTPSTPYNFRVLAINVTAVIVSSSVSLTTGAAAPNAPASLSASAGSPAYNTVALSWTASAVDGSHSAAATYQTQYVLASGGSWANFGSPIGGTSVNVTGLAHATAYNFQVIAANAGGTATSSSAGATTAAAVPNGVTGLMASAGSPVWSAVNVSWTAPAVDGTHDAATSFTVKYSTDGVSYTTAAGAWTSGNSAAVTGLAFSTAYYIQVIPSNAGGAGAAVATGSTIATGIAPPNVPTSLTATAGSPAYNTVALSWTASAVDGTHGAAATYQTQYVLASGGSWANFGSAIGGTSVNVTGLAHATAYNFQVVAANANGTATSSSAGATTAAAVPNGVTGLSASAGSPASSAIGVTWTAPAVDGTHDAATSFTVKYSTDGVSYTTAAGAWTSGNTATVMGLAHNTAYYIQVVPSNSGGAGAAVATGSTLTTDYAPPNVPGSVAAAPVRDGTTTKLAVTWTASTADSTHDAATGYDLQWSVHSAGSWTVVTGVSSGAVITGLSAGTSYDVQMRAKNSSGASPSAWSASSTVSTYSTVMSWNIAPASTQTHGATAAVNAHTTPNPSGVVGVNFSFSTSASSNINVAPGPWTALGSGGYPISGNVWGAYATAPSTTGTYYFWAVVNDGSGALVSSAITVT